MIRTQLENHLVLILRIFYGYFPISQIRNPIQDVFGLNCHFHFFAKLAALYITTVYEFLQLSLTGFMYVVLHSPCDLNNVSTYFSADRNCKTMGHSCASDDVFLVDGSLIIF